MMSLRFSLLCLSAVLVGFFIALPTMAEDTVSKDVAAQMDKDIKEAARARRKASEYARELLDSVQKGLKPREKNHLFIIYSNYNIIKTVETVQGDVENAIKKCGENNTDMKADMDDRLTSWNNVVDPVMKEANANLKNMIVAQDYTSKAKIDEIFNAVDETRKYASSQIQKVPVTTPEACTYLKNKMDDTEETMTGLLRTTLITYPRSFQKEPEENVPHKKSEDT